MKRIRLKPLHSLWDWNVTIKLQNQRFDWILLGPCGRIWAIYRQRLLPSRSKPSRCFALLKGGHQDLHLSIRRAVSYTSDQCPSHKANSYFRVPFLCNSVGKQKFRTLIFTRIQSLLGYITSITLSSGLAEKLQHYNFVATTLKYFPSRNTIAFKMKMQLVQINKKQFFPKI